MVTANDSVLKSVGSTLVPTTETNIELIKEKLSLKLTLEAMLVDVHFEFFNPSETQILTIGFIAPPMNSPEIMDDSDISKYEPEIYDFNVIVNGESLTFKRAILQETEFDFLKSKRMGQTFIYYFEVEFKPGLNIIKHKYSYTGGFDSLGNKFYDYILTSGNFWANKQIDNFSLTVNMGENSYFMFSPDLMRENELVCSMNGIMNNDRYEYFVKKGYLEFSGTNFSPLHELSLYLYTTKLNRSGKEYQRMYSFNEEQLTELDKNTLRKLRNNFFAFEGYNFENEDLKNHYKKFIWYIPDENVSSEDIYQNMDDFTKQRIALIRKIENMK